MGCGRKASGPHACRGAARQDPGRLRDAVSAGRPQSHRMPHSRGFSGAFRSFLDELTQKSDFADDTSWDDSCGKRSTGTAGSARGGAWARVRVGAGRLRR